MNEQGRRKFVISLATLAGLAYAPLPVLARELRSGVVKAGEEGRGDSGRGTASAGAQNSQYMTSERLAVLGAMAAIIVPEDATPSARDLGAADYVAGVLGTLPEPELMKVASRLDGVALMVQNTHGKEITQLDPDELQQVGTSITGREELQPLWLAVRALTVLFYYGQPQGFSDIGLPGPSIDRGGFPDPYGMSCLSA